MSDATVTITLPLDVAKRLRAATSETVWEGGGGVCDLLHALLGDALGDPEPVGLREKVRAAWGL